MKSREIIFTTVLSALVCFALCQVQSATDTPDPGSVPATNTADGAGALGHLTTGLYNAAFGFDSLLVNSDASFNTGVGAGTLLLNDATENTAVGAWALLNIPPALATRPLERSRSSTTGWPVQHRRRL